jgi:hypothetical protein
MKQFPTLSLKGGKPDAKGLLKRKTVATLARPFTMIN